MEEVFHIFSNGALTPDLFLSDRDFTLATNRLAVTAHLSDVRILAYSFEDTHLHVLAKGTVERCTRFKHELQRLINKWKTISLVLEMEEVTDSKYLMSVGTYVVCQATKDGKHVLPSDYKWSSASLYFRQGDIDLLWTLSEGHLFKDTVHMHEISLRTQRTMFHTRSRLPDDWMVCDGLILPSSFVDIEGFESIYKTHNCFRTYCGSSKASDQIVMESMAEKTGINMLETEARSIARQTSLSLFGVADIRKLNLSQRIRIGRTLRRKHHMGIPQISRRIYLRESEVRKVIK